MKKSLFVFYCCLATLSGIGQNSNTYINNYVQPSPNAASLGKFADFPVSYYTGVPEINVPIFQLSDGAVKVPISLSYHASGIRVSEVASWVGLGWCLNAGGMIIRTVRGVPDEGTSKSSGYLGPRGYYNDSGIRKMPLLPYPEGSQFISDPTQLQFQRTAPGLASGFVEGEPDLFTFNFNGYTGKFVFDESKTARLLSDGDLKIAVNYSPGAFNSWVITTPDGVKYFFGENSMNEVTLPHSTVSGDDIDAQKPSSWYLTRIVYPNSKDTVYLKYTPETYTYFDLGPESKLFNFGNFVGADIPSNVCDNTGTIKNTLRTTVNAQRLQYIKSRNDSIAFIATTQRLDISNFTTPPNRLDSIKIYINGQCYMQQALQYGYFQSSLSTQAVLNNPAMPVDASDAQRLKLLSVKEISGDGSVTKPPYTFLYQDTFQLPRRMSYDQDHWGFSNNSAGDANPYFTAGVSFAGACTSGGANRSPSWPSMEASALLVMRDPLGVTTKFEFEANNADNFYPTYTVGGLRVRRIIVTDSITGLQTVRKFQYKGGVLFKTPVYLIKLINEFYPSNGLCLSCGYQGYGNNPNIIWVLKQSQSIVPMQDVQGNQIGYTGVTEIFGNNGEGGSKVYSFQMNLNPHGSSRLSLYNYAAIQSVNTTFSGTVTALMGNAHFNDLTPQSLQYYGGYDVAQYYPYAPDQNDLRRGKLLNQWTYDSAGNLLQMISNTYQENYHEDYWIRGLKVNLNTYTTASSGVVTGYGLAFYKIHTGISHLVSSIETGFKNGKTSSSVHNYGYESALHTLQTSDSTVNSAGDSMIKKTYYSFDYANNATADGVFGKMKNRNLLAPIATRVWKNNQLVNGSITQYADFATVGTDTFVNPAKIYSLETSAPLTTAQAGESVAFTSPYTTLLPNTYFIEKADYNFNGTTGKVIEQKLVNDINQALIWDNTLSVLLAKTDNANFTDVAFSSFETAETGNWTYGSSSVVSDATAPTGAHAYTLGTTAISKNGLVSSTPYLISWWQKSGASVTVTGGSQSNAFTGLTINGYTYHEVQVTGTTSISIAGTGSVDEVRLYPATAQMTTYTYDPVLRLVAQCTVNGTIGYYEYDALHRLTDIKDQNGNIVKAFEYNYGRQSRTSQ